jgi:hypothetical protein
MSCQECNGMRHAILYGLLTNAQSRGKLPRCQHGSALIDWSGEELAPTCGCQAVALGVARATLMLSMVPRRAQDRGAE